MTSLMRFAQSSGRQGLWVKVEVSFVGAALLVASASLSILYAGNGNAAPVRISSYSNSVEVVAGNAVISTAPGAVMNINQSSNKAVINWDSFNVDSNATVNFNTPGANATTLNRVVGASRSMIDGAVRSNGQVVFVNPNGVTFGKGAQMLGMNVDGAVFKSLIVNNSGTITANSVINNGGVIEFVTDGVKQCAANGPARQVRKCGDAR